MGREFTVFLDSSAIHFITYEVDGQTLKVCFHGGRAYHYYDVPLQVAVDFATARSAGVFYNSHIKSEFEAPRWFGDSGVPKRAPTPASGYDLSRKSGG